jgi:hypothetical protein
LSQTEINLAQDAKYVLESKSFKTAFERMAAHLEAKALSCDVDNKEQAQRVVLAKQILAGIKREMERLVVDGTVAEIKLAEIKSRRKSVFRR